MSDRKCGLWLGNLSNWKISGNAVPAVVRCYFPGFVRNQRVCHHCDHHMRLPARKRLEMLFDNGHFTLITLPVPPVDPLKFKDKKRYSDRLRDAQTKTGQKDAIQVAHGQMGSLGGCCCRI